MGRSRSAARGARGECRGPNTRRNSVGARNKTGFPPWMAQTYACGSTRCSACACPELNCGRCLLDDRCRCTSLGARAPAYGAPPATPAAGVDLALSGFTTRQMDGTRSRTAASGCVAQRISRGDAIGIPVGRRLTWARGAQGDPPPGLAACFEIYRGATLVPQLRPCSSQPAWLPVRRGGGAGGRMAQAATLQATGSPIFAAAPALAGCHTDRPWAGIRRDGGKADGGGSG